MKKLNFITLVLGVTGGLLFSVGLCMCLLPEWNTFSAGVAVTAVGAAVLSGLLLVRWKMGGWKLKLNWKLIGKTAFGILAALVLGAGMCLILVWQMLLPGIIVGVIGIVLLLCLIPLCFGWKEN